MTEATCEIISSHMGLVAMVSDGTDIEHFHHRGQFSEWMALFQRNLKVRACSEFQGSLNLA